MSCDVIHIVLIYYFLLIVRLFLFFVFFFFNDTATTEIYTLSLHDALPIWRVLVARSDDIQIAVLARREMKSERLARRSEEHTSELQSHSDLVCRLLLEKKKKYNNPHTMRDYTHDIIRRVHAADGSTANDSQ